MMAEEDERTDEQKALDAQREREQRTPDVDRDDQAQFDEAFGSAAAGEDHPGEADGDGDFDLDAEGDEAGDGDASDADDAAAAAGDEQDAGTGDAAAGDAAADADAGSTDGQGAPAGEAEQEETWDRVGREIGALFENDEQNITPARIKHHVKTWHGRYRSERDKRRQAEQELEKLRGQGAGSDKGSSSGDRGSQGADPASSASLDELKSRFSKEYGEDLPQFVQDIVDARAREIAQEQATQAVKPLQERQQQVDDEEHYRQVTQAHPDADQLADSDDLWQWIDEQPPELREAYERIAQNGSTASVIGMLGSYKQARGIAADSTPEHESGQSEPAGSGDGGSDQGSGDGESAGAGQGAPRQAPRRPASRPANGPRRGDADPNDYDAAFDEALRAG